MPRSGARCSLPSLPVLLECCARLCPALGSGMGSTLSAADPCAHLGTATGQRCPTGTARPSRALCASPGALGSLGGCRGCSVSAPSALPADRPQRGAPEAVGQLWTEAELVPFPGTPAGTAELSSPQESPGGPGLGREGTGPAVRGGTATEPLRPLVTAGTADRAAPARLGVTSAGVSAPVEANTDPASTDPSGTDPAGHGTVEGATTVQGRLSHSPPSVTVPGSARAQWRSSSALLAWRAGGTALLQSRSATLLGDSSPGTRPSTVLATDSSAPATTGTSPFAGGLQRLLTPTETLQGTHWGSPGLSGGQGFASHSPEGPRSSPHPSALSLGPGGGPLASTAWSAVGTGPALLPATHRGSGLPLPTTMASTPGVTSPSQGGALDLTTGVLGPPERSHIPLSPSAIPGQPPGPPAPGSTAVAQGGVTHASAGSPHIPPSPQSAVTLLSTPLPSPGTGWGVLGFGPTVGTPLGDPSPALPHSSSRVGPAESPPPLGGTQVGAGSLAPPSTPGPPQQPALSQPALSQPASSLAPATALGVTASGVTATVPAALGDVGTVTPEPGAAELHRDVLGLTRGSPAHVPTDSHGTLGHGGGPGSPPAAVDTDLAKPSSSFGGRTDSDTPQVTPAGVGRAPQVFIVEDQPPLLRSESEVLESSAGAGGGEALGATSMRGVMVVTPGLAQFHAGPHLLPQHPSCTSPVSWCWTWASSRP